MPDEDPLKLASVYKPDYQLTIEDVRIILQFLWCRDDRVFADERYRIQMALLILVLAYSGARPDAFVESTSQRGTNEYLLYKVGNTVNSSFIRDECAKYR